MYIYINLNNKNIWIIQITVSLSPVESRLSTSQPACLLVGFIGHRPAAYGRPCEHKQPRLLSQWYYSLFHSTGFDCMPYGETFEGECKFNPQTTTHRHYLKLINPELEFLTITNDICVYCRPDYFVNRSIQKQNKNPTIWTPTFHAKPPSIWGPFPCPQQRS